MTITEATTVDDLLARGVRLDDESARDALRLVERLHSETLATLARYPDLSAAGLPALLRDLEALMRLYRGQLTRSINGHQQQAFDLGDDLLDAMLTQAGMRAGIVGISPTVLEIATAHASDQITRITEDARARVSGEVRLAALGGRSYGDLLRAIGRDLDDPGPFGTLAARAEAIARTEVGRVQSLSFRARGNQVAGQIPGLMKRWVHAGPMRAPSKRRGAYQPRPEHVALHGVTIPWDEEFSVGGENAFGPLDPKLSARQSVNCFPSSTVIWAAGVEGAYRRWYEGDLVEITTAAGNELAGTPNHPVLTDRGWVALGTLVEGDRVARYRFAEGVGGCNPDIQDMPATIGECFDALAVKGRTSRIHGGVVDFHGDGREGDVDVVSRESVLQMHFDPTTLQQASQPRLAVTNLLQGSLLDDGFVVQFDFAGRLAPTRGIRWTGNGASFFDRHPGIAQLDRFTIAAESYPGPLKPPLNRAARNTERLSDAVQGSARFVETDEVVHVKRHSFSGHVYNLQTPDGWYVANGVIVHNCTCQLRLDFSQVDDPAIRWDGEE